MRKLAQLLLVTLGLSVIVTTCGLLNRGDNYKLATELWSDVPRVGGLTPSPLEDVPPSFKSEIRIMRGSASHHDPAKIDWISFTSSGTPDDIGKFYNPSRMAASGWKREQNRECLSGSYQDLTQDVPQIGVDCIFYKTQAGEETDLLIIAPQNQNTKQTTVFFIRWTDTILPWELTVDAELTATPTP